MPVIRGEIWIDELKKAGTITKAADK